MPQKKNKKLILVLTTSIPETQVGKEISENIRTNKIGKIDKIGEISKNGDMDKNLEINLVQVYCI